MDQESTERTKDFVLFLVAKYLNTVRTPLLVMCTDHTMRIRLFPSLPPTLRHNRRLSPALSRDSSHHGSRERYVRTTDIYFKIDRILQQLSVRKTGCCLFILINLLSCLIAFDTSVKLLILPL